METNHGAVITNQVLSGP